MEVRNNSTRTKDQKMFMFLSILNIVMFTHTAGASIEMNPEDCWMGCYQMGARTWILIGLSETKDGKVICYCSPQADNYPNAAVDQNKIGISVMEPDGTRVHYPTCGPCLGHGFLNYNDGSTSELNCGRDGAIAVLEPLFKAAITKSIGVTIDGTAQADLPTFGGFKAFDVSRNFP